MPPLDWTWSRLVSTGRIRLQTPGPSPRTVAVQLPLRQLRRVLNQSPRNRQRSRRSSGARRRTLTANRSDVRRTGNERVAPASRPLSRGVPPPLPEGMVSEPSLLEFEVGSCMRVTRVVVGLASWKRSDHAAQGIPSGLVQGWVCAYKVADHVPRRNVESAFRRRAHGQRD